MAPDQRTHLVTALESFSVAAGERIDDTVWQWAPHIE
jgi:hypothetical protein